MTASEVERHYAPGHLFPAIAAALAGASSKDLAAIDEFHVRGRAATLELARRLAPARDALVLDIGAGLGGPARLLRADWGCRVVGIDLTLDYCRAARLLSERAGLAHGLSWCRADALALPFADDTFDAAWTQHAAMNIADKARLYAEVRRVLRPGGKFALYDVVQGPGGPIHLPVPWARAPGASHLVTADALRRLLGDAGFTLEHWRDTSGEARSWLVEAGRRQREKGPPALTLALLLGPEFPQMADNMRRNLEEERIGIIEAVCRNEEPGSTLPDP